MVRRVSRSVVALLFVVVLSLSTPATAFAAARDRGFDPSFGTRIVRFVKNLAKHLGFGLVSQEDIQPHPPIP